MNQIKGVVLDWAGTTIDYGCMAPVAAFQAAFSREGIGVSLELIRKYMGMSKMDHIAKILETREMKKQWQAIFNQGPTEDDLKRIFDNFSLTLIESLKEYTDLMPETISLIDYLHLNNIAVGSTTGYTAEMMAIVAPIVAAKGYAPDCYITKDDTSLGRPYPYMMYRNAERLNIFPMARLMKIGDTKIDILEGKNAGAITVGVVIGSSMMGLTKSEFDQLTPIEQELKIQSAKLAFYEAGADYVVNTLAEVPAIIDSLNDR